MKSLKVSLAVLAIVFAFASAFTSAKQTDVKYKIFGSTSWGTSQPTPQDATLGSPLSQNLQAVPQEEDLDLLKRDRCAASENICFVVVKYIDDSPTEIVDQRLGDFQ